MTDLGILNTTATHLSANILISQYLMSVQKNQKYSNKNSQEMESSNLFHTTKKKIH